MIASNNRSITAILNGGLGNQMFQYAAGRAYALRNSSNLTLNTGFFELDHFYRRKYALDIFNLNESINLTQDKSQAKLYIKLHALQGKNSQFKRLVNLFGYIDQPFVYEPYLYDAVRIFRDVMVGYWQDERYFNHIRSDLLRDFQPRDPLTVANQKIAETLNRRLNVVAIHLRCNHELATPVGSGNLPATPKAGQAHLLSSHYYKKAISEIYARVESPQFIIFSDNPAWVKANYDSFDTTLVLENDRGSDWEDLVLMSQCKHHIIANSSFSWWGAWLADSRDQVVIAPANCPYTPNIPSRWHLID
jgi:hypothetical protein